MSNRIVKEALIGLECSDALAAISCKVGINVIDDTLGGVMQCTILCWLIRTVCLLAEVGSQYYILTTNIIKLEIVMFGELYDVI